MHHCCSVYSISCTGPGWLNELGHWITGTCKGRFQDFKLGGALKKIAPSEGRREIFWVFRVKNHDFTPKNHIFSNFRRTRAGCSPPLDPPLLVSFKKYMPPPLPYFKVNICSFPLPHFASLFFAYLWSFRWPNYIFTLPRYFSLRLPHLNIPTGRPSEELDKNIQRT